LGGVPPALAFSFLGVPPGGGPSGNAVLTLPLTRAASISGFFPDSKSRNSATGSGCIITFSASMLMAFAPVVISGWISAPGASVFSRMPAEATLRVKISGR